MRANTLGSTRPDGEYGTGVLYKNRVTEVRKECIKILSQAGWDVIVQYLVFILINHPLGEGNQF
jgi:hypothetical protein